MVGAWCFVDQYGPDTPDAAACASRRTRTPGCRPSAGWSTGEVLHRDSLGSDALIRPGQLNLMTAGHGIAHSEESPPGAPRLAARRAAVGGAARRGTATSRPHFEHHADLPVRRAAGRSTATVIMGELGRRGRRRRRRTPRWSARRSRWPRAPTTLPLRPGLRVRGAGARRRGRASTASRWSRARCSTSAAAAPSSACAPTRPARVLLLGGEPFDEQIVMWWNFVGRRPRRDRRRPRAVDGGRPALRRGDRL